MAELDYGYEQTDYGYDTTATATATDYGYGEETDYGYGPQNSYGEQTDYGYDEQTDYGYGDARPEEDAPPTEPKPEAFAPRRQQVKRRCSVTKFSLDAGAQEANKAQEDMRSMVDMIRQGGIPHAPPEMDPNHGENANVQDLEHADEKSSAALTSSTASCDSSFDGEGTSSRHDHEKKTKKGMMSRMRKRLSVFH
jgi:hypothetical protein